MICNSLFDILFMTRKKGFFSTSYFFLKYRRISLLCTLAEFAHKNSSDFNCTPPMLDILLLHYILPEDFEYGATAA